MSLTSSINFNSGTLILEHWDKTSAESLPSVRWDERTLQFRAPARAYREIILALRDRKISCDDQARAYEQLEQLRLKETIHPRPHQQEALSAWRKADGQGTVSLPTGSGKTILAVMAIAEVKRSTLIVVPTIDLMQQWEGVLKKYFDMPVGLVGGGSYDVRPITVATYDSAQIHSERLGNRFAFLIFDEVHHLPAPQYQTIAMTAIAPYRLGLSATLQRSDGKESVIFDLVGPLVFEASIREMASKILAPYDIRTIEVPMSDAELAAYTEARGVYTDFLRSSGIRMSSPQGWMDFVIRSSRTPDGRQAMRAYWQQKRLAQASENKLAELWRILSSHKTARVLIFTDDNALAYRIGREFLVPVLTHKTRIKERKRMLEEFKSGTISILATSKVLNEGVDVPEANVGIVLSGSGAVREHVQRLGRILRHQADKHAILYELISKGTSEWHINQRRREHDAYKGSAAVSMPG